MHTRLRRLARRAIPCLALLAGLWVGQPLSAQGASGAASSLGEWTAKMSFGGNDITATITITRAADGSLQGTWTSERGEGPLSAVKLAGNKLTFVRRLEFSGQSIEMVFEGSIEGDSLSGAFVTEFGEMALTATRAAAPASPLAGTWDVTSNSQVGELKRTLIINADMTGSYESADAKWPIRNLQLTGSDVTFGVTVDLQGQQLPLEFTGKLEGPKLTGSYSIAQLGEISQVIAVKRAAPRTVQVVMATTLGEIEIELQIEAAPATTANFLRYVDESSYHGGHFHRAVRLDNQTRSDILIEVVQGGINPDRSDQAHPAIALERTSVTGLRHRDGTISMARGGPDTATSDFFICVGDQPSLDFGGQRNADGQGFAAFGRVVRGMDVVRAIQGSPTKDRERLTPPIGILSVRRVQ